MISTILDAYRSCARYKDCGTATESHTDYKTVAVFRTTFIRYRSFTFTCRKHAFVNGESYPMGCFQIFYDWRSSVLRVNDGKDVYDQSMALEACFGRSSVYSNKSIDVIPRLLLDLPKYEGWDASDLADGQDILRFEATCLYEGKLLISANKSMPVISKAICVWKFDYDEGWLQNMEAKNKETASTSEIIIFKSKLTS